VEAFGVKVTEQRTGQTTILRPRGPVVGADAEHLGRQIAKTLQEHPGAVILDATLMPYLDSQALEVLVDVTERLIRTGAALRICGASDVVREVLDLTELASLFELFPDVETALEGVR
jgi:anti-anti-sigma factor